jgi:exonuclease SbcD
MKFLHTADLHIGKNIFEFNMLEDQKYILQEILDIAKAEQVDGILLAGDIYDRSVPSTEAVQMLEWFLLEALSIAKVFLISGNHDSAERLSFGASLLEKSGLYIVGGKEVREVIMEDSHGKVAVHLLPFVKPAIVEASNSEEAVRVQLQKLKTSWNQADRHILMTHFFVCAGGKEPELSDSEQHSYVGGLDKVDSALFEAYDYVALGHIHKPQCMRRGKVYYAGSPLCYSFSECKVNSEEAFARKGVYIVELEEKGAMSVARKPLHPLRNMRIIKGNLQELMQQASSIEQINENIKNEDYLQVVLTDKDELIDPIGSLRSVYPNVMQIVLEKRLQEGSTPILRGFESKSKTMEELFVSFYEALAGEPMDEERVAVVRKISSEVDREG